MGFKSVEIEGQMALDMCLEPRHNIIQSNELVVGKQHLKLNSMKLIRLAIMQIGKNDESFKLYTIKLKELSQLLGVSKSSLSRDAGVITDDIISHPVFVYKNEGGRERWLKLPWVSVCAYDSEEGFSIKLNDDLRPYLLGLKEKYTLYSFLDIYELKTTYGIRLYELIQCYLYGSVPTKRGCQVEIGLDELKFSCGCEDKYSKYNHFKTKVLDTAVEDINKHGSVSVGYKTKKIGNKVGWIIFDVVAVI